MSMEVISTYGEYVTNNSDSTIRKKTVAQSDNSANYVEEYYEKLCKKFPSIKFNTNGGVMPCSSNKVVVNLSYGCLKKMASDPEFAKKIEWNLSGEAAANSQVYSFAKRDGVELGGRTVTYDANGNRQSSCGGMRTAKASNKKLGVLNAQKQQKAIRSGWDKKHEQEEYLEKVREKQKRNKEYLEELHEKQRNSEKYISEITENINPAVKVYTQTEYDDADLLSTVDTKI